MQLALNWLEAGYLDDTMLNQSAHRLVQTGMTRWANHWLGDTPLLSEFHFAYSIEGNYADKGESWDFCIDLGSPEIRLLAPVFQSIEDKVPGLFETAIHTLETVVDRVAKVGTPSGIRAMAVNDLWMGLTNTDEVIAELQSMEYDDDHIAEMLTPDKFDGGLPVWVLKAKQRLTQRQLKTLTKSTDADVAGIAQCVLDLLKLKKKVMPFFVDDMRSIYPLALLRWDDMDSVVRLSDDIVHEANSSGGEYFTSEIHSAQVPRDAQHFQAWRTSMEPSLAAIKLANQLIGYLSVLDEDYR